MDDAFQRPGPVCEGRSAGGKVVCCQPEDGNLFDPRHIPLDDGVEKVGGADGDSSNFGRGTRTSTIEPAGSVGCRCCRRSCQEGLQSLLDPKCHVAAGHGLVRRQNRIAAIL